MIIALEGLDGAGKTVQTDMLVGCMRDNGIGVTRFDFPDYDIPTGIAIQECLDATEVSYTKLHKLMAENRLARLQDIRDAQDRGDALIMNRYCHSNLVYGMANDLEREWLVALDAQMPAADLTVLLEISVADSFERKPKGTRDNLESRRNFMTRVSELYRQVARDMGWAQVDGRLDPRKVHNRILDYVTKLPGMDRLTGTS